MATTLNGAGAAFLRTAEAGNKTPINGEGLANGLGALGWTVTETLEAARIEGDGAYDAKEWLAVKLREGSVKFKRISGGFQRVGYSGKTKGLSSYQLIGEKAELEKAQEILKTLTSKEAGGVSVTLSKKGIVEQFHTFAQGGKRWKEATGDFELAVSVRVNIRVWEIANRKLKGTKKKPVYLKQVLKTLEPEDAKAIKGAKLWNSLYGRALQAEAQEFLKGYEGELPEQEETLTPEEELRRIYDKKVESLLMEYTGEHLEAVEQHFIERYRTMLAWFLNFQEEILPQYIEAWEAEGSPKHYGDTKFPPAGSGRWSRKEVTESQRHGNQYRERMASVIRFIERDEDRKYGNQFRIYKAKDNAEELVIEAGKNTAAAIRAAFVSKNTMKLSAILVGKGNLKDVTVRAWHKGSFNGELDVTFEDGCSFVVRNKTVYKYSSQGKWFAQFPTTFHQVIQPDGSKMKGTASERRMVEEFPAA